MDVAIRIVRGTVAGGEAREAGETVTVSSREAALLQQMGKAVAVLPDAETATALPDGETTAATQEAEAAVAPSARKRK